MKKDYFKPEIKLNLFEAGDIITTSNFGTKVDSNEVESIVNGNNSKFKVGINSTLGFNY